MRTPRAASIYLVLKTTWSFCAAVVYTVELVYQIQTVGLNPFQLVLAGTVQQSVSFLCQAPTGALADTYTRRGAIVLGLLLTGTADVVEGTIPAFAAVLVAQVLWSLGVTFMDGADAAWIADELGTERTGFVYLRATQFGWLATLPGIALSAALGSVRLGLPIVVGGGLYLALGAAMAVVMPERHFTPASHEGRSFWQQMGQTLVAGVRVVRGRPVLLNVLGVAALIGVFYAGFGQLWQYHLLHTFSFPALGRLAPIVWFGIIETVIALTNVVGIEVARRGVDTNDHRKVGWALVAGYGLMVAGVLGFAVAGQFALALATFWLVTMASGPRIPLEQAWMNQDLDAQVRATVFSLRAQVQALAAIAGGPVLGAIATAYTTRPALIASALVLSPALLLYARTARNSRPLAAAGDTEAQMTGFEDQI